MNKADLIKVIALESGLSTEQAKKVFESIIEMLTITLQQGQSLSIKGFGTFGVKNRKPRTGRNPMTGQSIEIAAAQIPFFKPSSLLKKAINVIDIEELAVETNDDNHAIMEVFYATNRNFVANQSPDKSYNAECSKQLNYGVTYVSIPRDHRMGELESPSIWKLQFKQNPDKHIMITQLKTFEKQGFYQQLSKQIKAAKNQSALIFFHGYNVSFKDAARRTAQMAYDLGFEGAASFYSWPSHASTARYTHDANNIEKSQTHIEEFLEDYAEKSGAENIYVIAHSMGNKGLTKAYISLLNKKPHLQHKFKEVILAAPDIDADVFEDDIAPAMARLSAPITLYASSNDIALKASKKVNGDRRAGDSGKNEIVIVKGVESIDCSHVETSFLGHSYYGDERSLLSDLFYLIKHQLRAASRSGLRELKREGEIYWTIKR